MTKAVAHPTDAKLSQRSLERIVRAAKKARIPLKRSTQRETRWVLKEYQRLMHGKRFRKAQKPLNKLKRYLSKMLNELDLILESCPRELLRAAAIRGKLLLQRKEDKHKIYSCHDPQVACIAKGKAKKPYEFGSKTSLMVSEKKGLVLSMKIHLGNPYDGHLLAEAKKRSEENSQTNLERILVDRSFRGHEVENAEVLVSYTKGLPEHLKWALKRRQAIEPWIGRIKQEGKLGRCHLKGLVVNEIHAFLVGIGHNFRTILRELRYFYPFLLTWVGKPP